MAKKAAKKKRAAKRPTWACRDGRVIEISKMDDSHLRNTIFMLKRNADKYRKLLCKERFDDAASAFSYQGGDHAMDAAQSDGSRNMDLGLFYLHAATVDQVLEAALPVWKDLVAECKKRKLQLFA